MSATPAELRARRAGVPARCGRWRPATGCWCACGLRRALGARSSGRARGRARALRQWRDRPLVARQSAVARRRARYAARPARAAERAGLLDADARSSACATSSRARSPTSIPKPRFDLGPSVAALEARLAADASAAPLPAKFGFVDRRRRRLPLGDVDADIRFEASRDGDASRSASRARTRWRDCAPARQATSRRGLARAFLALAGAGDGAPRRMRALVGAAARERRVRAAGAYETAPRAAIATRARRSRDVLGAHALRRARSSSAPRRRSASRRRRASRR